MQWPRATLAAKGSPDLKQTWTIAFHFRDVIMLDFNRANLSATPLNLTINDLIEQSVPEQDNVRQYLGASVAGDECLRRVQYNWLCNATYPARIKDISARGYFAEELTRQHLIRAGFQF